MTTKKMISPQLTWLLGISIANSVFAQTDACLNIMLQRDKANIKESSLNLNIFDLKKRVELAANGTGLNTVNANIYSCDSICIITPKTAPATMVSKSNWYISALGSGEINPEFITQPRESWYSPRLSSLVKIEYTITTPGSGWFAGANKTDVSFHFNFKTNTYSYQRSNTQVASGSCKKITSDPKKALSSSLISELYAGLSSGRYANSPSDRQGHLFKNTDNYYFSKNLKSIFYITKQMPRSEQVKVKDLKTKNETVMHISELKNYQAVANYYTPDNCTFCDDKFRTVDFDHKFLESLKTNIQAKLNCIDLSYRSSTTENSNLDYMYMQYNDNVSDDLSEEFQDLKDPKVSYVGAGQLLLSNIKKENDKPSSFNSVTELIEVNSSNGQPVYRLVNRKNSKLSSFGDYLRFQYPIDRLALRLGNLFCIQQDFNDKI